MSQMILSNQGEVKEIFPWIKKEAKQKQEGNSFPFQNEPSFKNIFAKINQEDERSGMPSVSTSADSMQTLKEETPCDEYGNVRGGLANEMVESSASGQSQEIISSLPVAEHGNMLDHGEEEGIIIGVNLVATVPIIEKATTNPALLNEKVVVSESLAATVPIEKAATEFTHLTKEENHILRGGTYLLGSKEEKGTAASLQVKVLNEEHPMGSMTEKGSFFIKGEKGEANLVNAATNKQEPPAIFQGKGNVMEEAVVLTGDMKKGAETSDLSIKDGAFKKTGDIQITAMSSPDAGTNDAGTKYKSEDTKLPSFAFKPLPSDIPENQGKVPFAMGFDKQNAEITEDEGLIIPGKESVPQGSVSGAAARQVYAGDRVAPKGVVIPMEQIIKETGNLLEKGGKVQLILHPPSLGKINMEVVVRNNRVELLMMVSNTDVQQVLQASSDQLRNSLQNQGFQFDQMSVLLKRENMGADSGRNPLWQNGQQEGEGRGGRQDTAPTEELAELKSTHYDETKNISIFA